MEVSLQPEKEARLAKIAAQRGIKREELARQIISQYLDADRNFVKAVNVGIKAADRGDFVEHEEVGSRLKSQLEGGLGTEIADLFRDCWLDAPISELRGFTLESPFESSPEKTPGLRPADSRGRLSPHKPSRKPSRKPRKKRT